MKKYTIISTIFLIVFIFLTIISCEKKDENIIKVGAIFPLTGSAATWGNNMLEATQLAMDEINLKGGIDGKILKILYGDSKGEAKEGIALINRFITQDNVKVIIDDAVSTVAFAIIPIATEHNIPIISVASTNPKLTEAGKYFFRVWNSDAEEALISSQWATTRGWKTCAIIYIDNDYGKGLNDHFSRKFIDQGGKVLYADQFKQDAIEYKNILSKVRSINEIGFIYLVGYPDEIKRILKQMSDFKIHIPIIGTAAFNSGDMLIHSKEHQIFFPRAIESTNSNEYLLFRQKFNKKFLKEPGITAPEAYDVVFIIKDALERAKSLKGDMIQVELEKIKDFIGASGIITFDENGDVHKPMEFIEINNGAFVQIGE